MKKNIKEITSTTSMAVADGTVKQGPVKHKYDITKKADFDTAQKAYDYYLENVRKTKTGKFIVKYGQKSFTDPNINLLYEKFQKYIFGV